VITHDSFFIGGSWIKPAGTRIAEVISPINEEIFGQLPEATNADMDRAVAAARHAFDRGPWPRMSIDERCTFMARLAEHLRPLIPAAIDMQINEMGGARKFIGPATHACLGSRIHDGIKIAKTMSLREVRDGVFGKVVVTRQSVGVVAAIVPWNVPLSAFMLKVIPALLTGCPIVVKPSPESPLSCHVVGDAAIAAGLPEGVINIVPGGREVGEYLVSHPGVDKVTFTGSTAAGRRVGSICGNLIRPCTLELGGKSAGIILDDFDLDKNFSIVMDKTLGNNSQLCVCNTRVLVSANRYQDVIDHYAAAIGRMKIGNPHDEDTDWGPLAGERHRARVEGYIKSGLEEGAKLVVGGGRPPIAKGWYVQPTIFADVDNGMRIAKEEIFGPVISVIRYETLDDAIRIANESEYGLGGGVYTSDVPRGVAVAEQIDTGSLVVNNGIFAGGGGPFGGHKQSGLGVENGPEGMASHYRFKSISLAPGAVP
jgi:aldehyde dehydrogenase (NAD+)